MEMSKKRFSLAILLTVIMAVGSTYACMQNGYFNSGQSRSKPSANVFVTIQNEMGTYDLFDHNLITNIGENQTGIRMGINASYVEARWISLGNATPAATLTKLTTEATTLGAERAKGTFVAWTSGGDYAFNVTHKFTFSGAITLNCAGLQWSATGGSDSNMYACAAFTSTAFANNWNLTINI